MLSEASEDQVVRGRRCLVNIGGLLGGKRVPARNFCLVDCKAKGGCYLKEFVIKLRTGMLYGYPLKRAMAVSLAAGIPGIPSRTENAIDVGHGDETTT